MVNHYRSCIYKHVFIFYFKRVCFGCLRKSSRRFARQVHGNFPTQNMNELKLVSKHKRYFTNPCANNPEALTNVVGAEWILESIEKLQNKLLSRRVTSDECEEGGPYTGVGGIGYALLRIATLPKTSKEECIKMCVKLVENQLSHNQNPSPSHSSRYLTGPLGLYVIQALANHMAHQSIDFIIKYYKSLLNVVLVSGYQRIGDDEMLNGRAGFLTGVLLLRLKVGHQILYDADIRRVIDAIIFSGREYSVQHQSEARLMFQWHGSEYLGAAHGVSGIYYILLSFWELLNASEREDVRQSVGWYLTLQTADGNFPSSSKHIGEDRGDNELVHWCHGATGAIQMLIAAHTVFGSSRYVEAAKRCGDLIWRRGLLRKGPGICHGVAGGGYAFLLLYRLTGDIAYVEKAKAFAAIMMDPSFEKMARVPDMPYSLFEGWAGALCFLADLLQPTDAQFPMVPIVFKHSSSSLSSSQ